MWASFISLGKTGEVMNNVFQRLATTVGALMMVGGMSTIAMAQDNSTTETDNSFTVEAENAVLGDEAAEEAVKSAAQRDTGWYPTLRIGGSAALNYNKNVDGVNDGTALTFGVYLKGALDAVYKNFEWQNKLDIEHQETKTPTIEDFIKTADKLDFRTLVLFRIPKAEWLGPFARFRLQTSLFEGRYITDEDTTIRYYKSGTDIDEKSTDNLLRTRELKSQESVKLSNAFEPLLLSESAGLFINPYTSTMFNINFKAGVAGQHLFADGGYVSFDDDDDDAYYDVIQLIDTNSVGIEGELEFSGIFVGYVNWSLAGSLYYPFKVDEDHGLKDADLIHATVEAKISVRLANWASLDYAFTMKRQPFVTTDWQINNTILFNLGFDVF
jgi:hypothetical protein